MSAAKNLGLLAIIVLLLYGASAFADPIPVGQVDDFQDGTLQHWEGGAARTNIPTGGPAGDGDRYLRINSGGEHLGAKNDTQWAGDYVANGMTRIAMHLKNDGPAEVQLRILFKRGSSQYASTTAATLSAQSGWRRTVFGLTPDDLTRVRGSDSLEEVLSDVDRWVIHHDPGSPSPSGDSPNINATIGVDNIIAVPEPATLALLAAAALCGLATIRRKRQ